VIELEGTMHRSKIVGLNVEDITRVLDDLVVTIRHSKTDQEGEGQSIGIPYGSHPETCPVHTRIGYPFQGIPRVLSFAQLVVMDTFYLHVCPTKQLLLS